MRPEAGIANHLRRELGEQAVHLDAGETEHFSELWFSALNQPRRRHRVGWPLLAAVRFKSYLKRSIRIRNCPPHVGCWTIVVPQPFNRLFEVTADDVGEFGRIDDMIRVERVEIVDGD